MTHLFVFAPTSSVISLDLSPSAVACVDIMEDLSGFNDDSSHLLSIENLPETTFSIFEELSHGYVPVMIANSIAFKEGQETWSTKIDNQICEQKTFPYQAKCLEWIRDEFNKLE